MKKEDGMEALALRNCFPQRAESLFSPWGNPAARQEESPVGSDAAVPADLSVGRDSSCWRKEFCAVVVTLYCRCGEMLEDDPGKGMLGHSLNSC